MRKLKILSLVLIIFMFSGFTGCEPEPDDGYIYSDEYSECLQDVGSINYCLDSNPNNND